MIGQRVNNYEVIAAIGEGGMGTVYLARHPLINRKAAIKVLRPELARDQSLVARFFNEARAANAIGHPNIIDIIDVGFLPAGSLPYLMMEFLEGESLDRRLKRAGRIRTGDAVEFAFQTASALAAAHGKGIIHRDLKPENLFLVPDATVPGREQVKVLDFGIAKLLEDVSEGKVKTQTGSLMGTPPYMSPEQCRGSGTIDHRTDIYALGCILYEMLCGAPPFSAPGLGEILVMHLTQPPPPPRERNPGIPEHLEGVILRALAKQPEDRFATMAALQAALGTGPARTVSTVPAAEPGSGAAAGAGLIPAGPAAARAADLAAEGAAPATGSSMSASHVSGRGTTTFSSSATELDEITGAGTGRARRWALLGVGGAAASGVLYWALKPATTRAPAGRPPVEPAGAAAQPETRSPSAAKPAAVPANAPTAAVVRPSPGRPDAGASAQPAWSRTGSAKAPRPPKRAPGGPKAPPVRSAGPEKW